MNTLSRELRKLLEKKVIEARVEAEKGAEKALREYAVHEPEPYGFMNDEQKRLRLRLRAHGRQVGDIAFDDKRQEIRRLREECAYEHWHRMLFARFLAENHLLLEAETQSPVSLDECRELAADGDWVALASEFAERMLPRIFRSDDPLLRINLPGENRIALEKLLEELPTEVFQADDSLGWVYQFWQAERKRQVNDSGVKIGADELAPVTELFTDDYIVSFLLHNTLGAWWTAKRKTEGKSPSIPGYQWTYLRLQDDGMPIAGSFSGWPRSSKDLKVLDPCMGSGHFLVFALPILVAFRMEEEGLSCEKAVEAVLRDNLFGLEIDQRCTQLAAFNLALTAWRMVGYRPLPQLKLASSGLGIHAKEDEWMNLAGKDAQSRETMRRLYHLFQQAPVLGSLIDPSGIHGGLFTTEFEKVRPLLERALAAEHTHAFEDELAVTAKGILQASQIFITGFTLVATNVPYLGRGKQTDTLQEYCDSHHPLAKSDLATCFLERCLRFCCADGTVAVVTPQNWLFLGTYRRLREQLLRTVCWDFVARLGEHGFESSQAAGAFAALVALTRRLPSASQSVFAIDAANEKGPKEKAITLRTGTGVTLKQLSIRNNPDSAFSLDVIDSTKLLGQYAECFQGISPGDTPRLTLNFWEIPFNSVTWKPFQGPPAETSLYGGREFAINWEVLDRGFESAAIRGSEAWGKKGVAIGQMRSLPATLYSGDLFANSTPVIIPKREEYLPAIWAFCRAGLFNEELRKLNPKVSVDNGYVNKVPFNFQYWNGVAAKEFQATLPSPSSSDPTQWLFNGHPLNSEHPLQVAVARLLGYRWPRQTGYGFTDCSSITDDGLGSFAEEDGIICLHALKGHHSATERLKELIAAAYGSEWSTATIPELLKQACATSTNLEDWLRDEFFEQHCEKFHQRPFIWHISDGLNNGFHALVNYHKLAGPNGEGRRTLDNLTYRYLGDWIQRKQSEETRNVAGAAAQLAAAEHLQKQLIKIIEGAPPYDIFVRWKPLHEQPIGWEPDPNDGVRLNIRPFMIAKPYNAKGKNSCILRFTPKTIRWDNADRGKEQVRSKDDFPWLYGWDGMSEDFVGGAKFGGNRWNGLHYSLSTKRAAREKHSAANKKGQHA